MHLYLPYIYIHYSNLYLLFAFISVYLEIFDSERLNLLELWIYKMWQVKISFDKRKYPEKRVHVLYQILEISGSISGSPTLQADSLLSEPLGKPDPGEE